MPDQVNNFAKPRICSGQMCHLAPNSLLHIVRSAGQVLLILLTPLLPPAGGGEGEGDVEDSEGHPKGGEDGEETKLDRDALGAIVATKTTSTGGAKQILAHVHLETDQATTRRLLCNNW